MYGNCSTRDGRSRVAAPEDPHVLWSTKLPTDSTGQMGPSAIATDSSGHAYVVTEGEIDESIAAIRRFRASSGALDWSRSILPDEETGTPIVLASGGIALFAYTPADRDAVFTFDPANGRSSSTSFGFDLYYAPGELAVGSDGSLYVVHSNGGGTATWISRVGPDAATLWTSVDLGTIGPPALDGDVSPSTLALDHGDLVICVIGILQQKGETLLVVAFDPNSGAVRWSTPIAGEIVGGPAVAPDGNIAMIIDAGTSSSLFEVEPVHGRAKAMPLDQGAFGIFAITTRGVVIAGGDAGNGVTGLVALSPQGKTLWTRAGPEHATVASNGIVVAFGPNIEGLDEATGEPKWTLAPPVSGKCIIDAALTSDHRIVALQCDGTLFGAGD